jgi:hypothetical protein
MQENKGKAHPFLLLGKCHAEISTTIGKGNLRMHLPQFANDPIEAPRA